MEDQAFIYRTKGLLNAEETLGIVMHHCTAYLPDLNPIENVPRIMKQHPNVMAWLGACLKVGSG